MVRRKTTFDELDISQYDVDYLVSSLKQKPNGEERSNYSFVETLPEDDNNSSLINGYSAFMEIENSWLRSLS
jgi:hypothetical protein